MRYINRLFTLFLLKDKRCPPIFSLSNSVSAGLLLECVLMYTASLIAGTNRRPICCVLAMRWRTVTAIDNPLLILLRINNWRLNIYILMIHHNYISAEGDLTNEDWGRRKIGDWSRDLLGESWTGQNDHLTNEEDEELRFSLRFSHIGLLRHCARYKSTYYYQGCREYEISHPYPYPYPYPQIFRGYPWIYPYPQMPILCKRVSTK